MLWALGRGHLLWLAEIFMLCLAVSISLAGAACPRFSEETPSFSTELRFILKCLLLFYIYGAIGGRDGYIYIGCICEISRQEIVFCGNVVPRARDHELVRLSWNCFAVRAEMIPNLPPGNISRARFDHSTQ